MKVAVGFFILLGTVVVYISVFDFSISGWFSGSIDGCQPCWRYQRRIRRLHWSDWTMGQSAGSRHGTRKSHHIHLFITKYIFSFFLFSLSLSLSRVFNVLVKRDETKTQIWTGADRLFFFSPHTNVIDWFSWNVWNSLDYYSVWLIISIFVIISVVVFNLLVLICNLNSYVKAWDFSMHLFIVEHVQLFFLRVLTIQNPCQIRRSKDANRSCSWLIFYAALLILIWLRFQSSLSHNSNQ